MTISLQKGQRTDLTKTNAGLKSVIVGLGWDPYEYSGSQAFDLDTAAFLVSENGKVRDDSDFIFYNNKKHPSGSVIHMGDNTTGDGEGDDEQIIVDIDKIPSDITKIIFTASIHEAALRKQNFGQVSNSFIRFLNQSDNCEIMRYDLTEDFSIETAVIFGELYRHNAEWKFTAVGQGIHDGLEGLCKQFGINIA